MSDPGSRDNLKDVAQEIKNYIEKRVEIYSLEFQERGASVLAAIIGDIAGLALIGLAVLFVLTAGGIGLGYLLDNMALGFALLSLILFLLGFYVFKYKRNKFKTMLKQKIINFIDNI